MTKSPIPLLDRIRKYADGRPDLLVADSPVKNAQLWIFQVSRTQKFESIGDGPFTKHEKTSWMYFSRVILVDTRIKDRLTAKQIDTRDLMKLMGLRWVGCRTIDDLLTEIGDKPEPWTLESARPEKIA